jgi:hypothetical protein
MGAAFEWYRTERDIILCTFATKQQQTETAATKFYVTVLLLLF